MVNHFAISSLFEDQGKVKKVFSYRVEKMDYERVETNDSFLILGQVRVTPEMIPETKEYCFGLIPSNKDIYRTWVLGCEEGLPLVGLKAKIAECLRKDEDELARVLTSVLQDHIYTLQDTFREERRSLLQKVLQKEVDTHKRIYAELFGRVRQSIAPLVKLGLEIPYEVRVAAEVTLSDRLFQEVKRFVDDFKDTLKGGVIDRIVEEADQYGYKLRREEPSLILDRMLIQRMEMLQKGMVQDPPETVEAQAERVEAFLTLLERAEKWGFKLRKEETQNIMDEILGKYFGELEMGWWGWGPKMETPFPSNLILLAEKLNFNVERFSKIKLNC